MKEHFRKEIRKDLRNWVGGKSSHIGTICDIKIISRATYNALQRALNYANPKVTLNNGKAELSKLNKKNKHEFKFMPSWQDILKFRFEWNKKFKSLTYVDSQVMNTNVAGNPSPLFCKPANPEQWITTILNIDFTADVTQGHILAHVFEYKNSINLPKIVNSPLQIAFDAYVAKGIKSTQITSLSVNTTYWEPGCRKLVPYIYIYVSVYVNINVNTNVNTNVNINLVVYMYLVDLMQVIHVRYLKWVIKMNE